MNLRVWKGAARSLPQRALVLSRKAQLWLMYAGANLDHLVRMEELREEYLEARDHNSINRITAAEIEHVLQTGGELKPKRKGH